MSDIYCEGCQNPKVQCLCNKHVITDNSKVNENLIAINKELELKLSTLKKLADAIINPALEILPNTYSKEIQEYLDYGKQF